MILHSSRIDPSIRGVNEYACRSNVSPTSAPPGKRVQQEGPKGVSLETDFFENNFEVYSSHHDQLTLGAQALFAHLPKQLNDGWEGNARSSSDEPQAPEADTSNTYGQQCSSYTTEFLVKQDNVIIEDSVEELVQVQGGEARDETSEESTNRSAVVYGSVIEPATLTPSSSPDASLCAVDAHVKGSLKSALKGTTAGRSGLRVTWAPDVYDPLPSLMSHTLGRKSRNQRKSYSRRQKSDGKGKGTKSGKPSKKSPKGGISKIMDHANPVATMEHVPAAQVVAVKEAIVDVSEGSDGDSSGVGSPPSVAGFPADVDDDGWSVVVPKSLRRQRSGSSSPPQSPPQSSPLGDASCPLSQSVTANFEPLRLLGGVDEGGINGVPSCVNDLQFPDSRLQEDQSKLFIKVTGMRCMDDGHMSSPESTLKNPALESREGSPELSSSPSSQSYSFETMGYGAVAKAGGSGKRSESRSNQSKSTQRSQSKNDSHLAKVSVERLAGATAMAHGKMEEGKVLVQSAYAASRKYGLKGEEARCLRLLADTQVGQERFCSLLAAVEELSVHGLPFEHAEALLCLAQHEVQEFMNKAGGSDMKLSSASLEKVLDSLKSSLPKTGLCSSHQHLQTAASLLVTELSSSRFSCLKSSRHPFASPTGRRKLTSLKKTKKPDLLEEEHTTLSGLLASIHELAGNVGAMMRHCDDAHSLL